MSLALIIIGSLLIGLVLSGLLALKVKAGHYMKERKLKGKIRELEEENAENRKKIGNVPHFRTRPKTSSEARTDTDTSEPIIKPFNPEK